MARIDETILTGEIETLTPESASRILARTEETAARPDETDLSLEGDEERTTFLARPTGFSTGLVARPVGREDRTAFDAPLPKRAAVFDTDEKTIVAPMPAPRAREIATPTRVFGGTRPATGARATPAPPWERRAVEKVALSSPSRIEQIREATHVAFPLPNLTPERELPAWTREDRTHVLPPAPAPRVQVDRTDTLSPSTWPVSPDAPDSMTTLASDTSRTAATVMIQRPGRSSALLLAASIGMVGAIFVTGIALGTLAGRTATTSAAASGGAGAVTMIRSQAPAAESPLFVGHAASTPTPTSTSTPTPNVTATPAPSPTSKLVEDAPKRAVAAVPARAWSAPAPRPVAARAAVAPAPKAAPAAKHVTTTGDDVDEANAADALAKAQLDASLR